MKLCDQQQSLPLAIASDRLKLLQSLLCVLPTRASYRTYLAMIYADILPA